MLDQPFVIQNMKDMQAIFRAETNACNKLDADLQELEDAMLTPTAPLWMIQRKEEAYELKHSDSETLEERRYRVYVKEHEKIPFTIRTLRKMLDSLCGEGYELSIDQHGKELFCLVEIYSQHMVKDVYELLDRVVPADLYIEVEIRYHTWREAAQMSWGDAGRMTWKQIRGGEWNDTDG